MKQAHLYIKGQVIGVGFRAWTRLKAKQFDLTGWVKNVYDRSDVFGVHGGVEAVVQGQDEQIIQRFIKEVEKGPETSVVDEVEVFWEEPKEIFEDFEIRK